MHGAAGHGGKALLFELLHPKELRNVAPFRATACLPDKVAVLARLHLAVAAAARATTPLNSARPAIEWLMNDERRGDHVLKRDIDVLPLAQKIPCIQGGKRRQPRRSIHPRTATACRHV